MQLLTCSFFEGMFLLLYVLVWCPIYFLLLFSDLFWTFSLNFLVFAVLYHRVKFLCTLCTFGEYINSSSFSEIVLKKELKSALINSVWKVMKHISDWITDNWQSVFYGHWPSPFSSSSLATAERDAADGQPAFRHHQRRPGDGRGAARPDRRKRQGEHSLLMEPSPEICLTSITAHPPSSGSSVLCPSSTVCDYSHAAVIDIPQAVCFTSFLSLNLLRWSQYFKKLRRLNWAHLGGRVGSAVQVWST